MKLRILLHKLRYYRGRKFFTVYYKVLGFRGKIFLAWYRFLFPKLNVGANPTIWGSFYIMMYDPMNGSIEIGNNLHMVSDARRAGITCYSPSKFTTIGEAKIKIGDHVSMTGTVITCKKYVEIGSHTMIAPNVIIVDTDFHAQWPPEARSVPVDPQFNRAVKIGNYVWIGMNSIILKGVEIGDNTIIGAGSVVSSSIPGNVLAAGNPARVIRRLDQPDL